MHMQPADAHRRLLFFAVNIGVDQFRKAVKIQFEKVSKARDTSILRRCGSAFSEILDWMALVDNADNAMHG